MAGTLGYRDAVVLLGMDPPAVAALDRALGGALSLATGGVSDRVLSIFEAQDRIIGLGRDLILGLRDRLRGVRRVERTRRLEAAHAVIVVTAYFEVLADTRLPFAVTKLRMTRQEQLRLVGAPAQVQGFLDALLTVAPPMPTADLPYERFLDALGQWYRHLSSRLVSFASGLVFWDGMDDTSRAQAEQILSGPVCEQAVGRFGELYSQLARDIPEFGFWSGQIEHQATRAEIRRALADVEFMLASMSPGGPPVDAAAALSTAYRAALSRPILTEGDVPAGICLPTLEEGYLDPDFRVRPVVSGDWPADEAWWSNVPVRSDLTEYLAAALTSPEARSAPLVVLGQPGAGKSALTKVLAARLPATDFLPVRVVLRDAHAEAEIQDQIESAIRAETGEHLPWPQVAKAASGPLPVVLLDGFDELLQATSVSQSDYLLKVARFQQREADQGRPAVVLVTSRTAVADRARYPEGAVALRLEPFRPDQTQSWLERWNTLNEAYLAARSLSPLPASIVARHEALACQPLLLMMLALYDADANALQRATVGTGDGEPLDETALYEKLLTAFAVREVAKSSASLRDEKVATEVEQELRRLSLVAFGIINRQRQWITETELDSDLAALRTEAPAVSRDDFKAPLTQADVTLGRFFFIQRAQAVREGTRLQTYEFLHATFAEFLAARLTAQLAANLLTCQDPLDFGPAVINDDRLYALLSFAPLSSRQILRFVRGACARQIGPADRPRLAGLLINVLTESTSRTGNRYADYRPRALAISSRHGIYSANLVLLILVLRQSVIASELFPGSDDPVGTWKRGTLLWRSSLTEVGWTDLALAISIRHTWNETARDLEIRLASDPPEPSEPVDPYWLQGYPPGHEARGHRAWYLGYWFQLNHKMDVAGGTNDSFIRHALEPVFRWLGPTLTSFAGIGDGPAASAAHDLLNVWLSGSLSEPEGLAAAYEHFGVWAEGLPPWDAETRFRVQMLVLYCLRRDASRLSAAIVAPILQTIVPPLGGEPANVVDRHIHLVLETALAALSADPESEQQTELKAIAARAAEILRRNPASTLKTWIALHNAGLPHGVVFGEDPREFLDKFPFAAVAGGYPELVKQASAIASTRYGVSISM